MILLLMAGAVGLEPTRTLRSSVLETGAIAAMRHPYILFIPYIYIISYFFIKINKDKNGERNVTENYVPHIKLICPKDLTGQAPSSNHGPYHARRL